MPAERTCEPPDPAILQNLVSIAFEVWKHPKHAISHARDSPIRSPNRPAFPEAISISGDNAVA
jgi:hypothetical protein